jgi:UDP-N-acetylmuramoyl-L-alanyl-D-glutamate--2,6-diaminopimelate ligase
VLAVMAVCGGLGVPLAAIAEALAAVESVPGRFERVDAGQPFQVIVDYAHTEDGLRNVLRAAREICRKRVLVVFGCGGDRDRTKRPKMARAVAELGDYAVVTSDNPRTEEPKSILLDIEAGMRDAGKNRDEHYLVIEDRRRAIETAIAMACPGDLVLIAGKGHEDYQILGTERVPFDDRVVARIAIEAILR